MNKEKKSCRIDIRTTKSTKEKLEKAAKRANLSLSSYVVSVTCRQANLDIEPMKTYSLNREDSIRFYEAITHPRKPSKALKKLLNDIKKDMQLQKDSAEKV